MNIKNYFVAKTIILVVLFANLSSGFAQKTNTTPQIIALQKINETTIQISFKNQQKLLVDFYGENIFRLFQDNSGQDMRMPNAKPKAKILVENPRRKIGKLNLTQNKTKATISTNKIKILFNKHTSLFTIINLKTNTIIAEEIAPITFEKEKTTLTLKENSHEYFYGGGVQNGRFSHKGKSISIENQNSWTDGGVASPTPFYWSSKGYGILWYTFKKGKYDFGAKKPGIVKLYHNTNYLDVFFMVNETPIGLLENYYQLTGNPVLLPKFGFYEGHLNAYNRDYWKENNKGIRFEDDKKYKESQKNNGGIKESLNGEKNNYQFSARAVIDRYKNNDMPLGWILPNDGYGAGYGQTSTLDGNIQNLKEFGDYARKNGVQIGLWTQSDLHPKEGVSPLLQRDIEKEVGVAGVRVLKTDVAWVGEGYSFGLHGVSDASNIVTKFGNSARPFIISLDGWAGTQRYATIWSGDQTGGVWEYIRFHIPTYIGSGLSGIPNITSDMDGIFGGKNPIINTRDFQWKTFTPMQLNMDGWGSNIKYPHALGEPTTSINRNYLKLKSELIPYSYSIAKEAVTGLPIVRALFLEDKNDFTQGIATQYEFMYGPNFLIAPIYQNTKSDDKGNDIRNGIYLPKGLWIDYFTGEQYEGNQVINSFSSPIWKLPIFVKRGAIIPLTNPNNNVTEIDKNLRIYEVYPFANSSFTNYDDDGKTVAYKNGTGTTTRIQSQLDKNNLLKLTVNTTQGNFDGFETEKITEFRINTTQKPTKISAKIGHRKTRLKEAHNFADFQKNTNVYFYNDNVNFNQFSTKGSDFEKVAIIRNPQILVKIKKTNITKKKIEVKITGYHFNPINKLKTKLGALTAPNSIQISKKNSQAYSLKPTWNPVKNADYYEINFKGIRYTTIKENEFLFEGLEPETTYTFKLRAVNKEGVSSWKTFSGKTASNPLKYAIHGLVGKVNVKNQGGYEISKLFDFDESNMWHTIWGSNSLPFEITIDLKSVNQLDKFQYIPRGGKRNGVFLKGKVFYSLDQKNWIAAGDFIRENHEGTQEFKFKNHPTARYLKIAINKAVGGFGSGRELYVFKVPETESFFSGDINNDKKIDDNDLTSYTNYIGLKKGDADFEGYISKGDVNKNNLIDAYDVSVVATQLEGGASNKNIKKVSGNLIFSTSKTIFNKDETIVILVKGDQLTSVNALSFALPYNAKDFDFVGIHMLNTEKMVDLTNNRLHSDGTKVLYPTFVNIGQQKSLEGSKNLFLIQFKAKRKIKFDLKATNGILVNKNLESIGF